MTRPACGPERLQWLHTASNGLSTHLLVRNKRDEQALRSASSMLPLFKGWTMHDHLRASGTFTQAQHRACNAHILRELQGLMEEGSAWGRAMHPFLPEMSQQVLSLRGGTAAEHTRQHYRRVLSRAKVEEPSLAATHGSGRPKSTPECNLLRRLREHGNAVLAVALVEGMPFTTNRAERDIRPAKVNQNVSG